MGSNSQRVIDLLTELRQQFLLHYQRSALQDAWISGSCKRLSGNVSAVPIIPYASHLKIGKQGTIARLCTKCRTHIQFSNQLTIKWENNRTFVCFLCIVIKCGRVRYNNAKAASVLSRTPVNIPQFDTPLIGVVVQYTSSLQVFNRRGD